MIEVPRNPEEPQKVGIEDVGTNPDPGSISFVLASLRPPLVVDASCRK